MSKMTIYMMFRDRPFDPEIRKCYGYRILEQDFELVHVLNAMAGNDCLIHNVCSAALYNPLITLEEINFRHAVLQDARRNRESVRRVYALLTDALNLREETQRGRYLSNVPGMYDVYCDLLAGQVNILRQLREAAEDKNALFVSESFVQFLKFLKTELNEAFFDGADAELKALYKIDAREAIVTATLNSELYDIEYTLTSANVPWVQWKLISGYSFDEDTQTSDWDTRLRGAFGPILGALGEVTYNLEKFFKALRCELAFYIGCLNLEDTLTELGMPVCIPELRPDSSNNRMYRGLYDTALALSAKNSVAGNNLDAADVSLYIITGANQGGKSTFLRSIGQSQLMAQCGMLVCAESAEIPLRRMIYSHFKREEDHGMRSGKLDEELSRINDIVEYIKPRSMILFNESFASTNEREGSEIGGQITRALLKHKIEMFSVTHLYTYANSFTGENNTMFLRAQRLDSGERTFKLVPGEPLSTAFGDELYTRIFVN